MKNVKNTIQKRKKSNLDNRKGVVDVQFNWIFVMIAGFVIFLFIIGIVVSQKRNADAQIGISAINQITALLKGQQQTANVYSEISLPSTNINFRCEQTTANTQYFTFKIENSQRVPLSTEIIFAPQDLTTSKIMVWSQAFDIGFPVNVFTYITTADSIILIYDPQYDSSQPDSNSYSAYSSQIYHDLPGNVTKKIISKQDDISKNSNYAHVKVVCFQNDCPPANKYDYINITPANGVGLYDYGNVTFHIKGKADTPAQIVPYITKAGLYGAIFSDNQNYYNCQMSRALGQFEVKRSLVDSRLRLIQDALDAGDCKQTVNISLELDIGKMRSPQLNEDNMTLLYQKTKDLDNDNTNLILYSCPKIY